MFGGLAVLCFPAGFLPGFFISTSLAAIAPFCKAASDFKAAMVEEFTPDLAAINLACGSDDGGG